MSTTQPTAPAALSAIRTESDRRSKRGTRAIAVEALDDCGAHELAMALQTRKESEHESTYMAARRWLTTRLRVVASETAIGVNGQTAALRTALGAVADAWGWNEVE